MADEMMGLAEVFATLSPDLQDNFRADFVMATPETVHALFAKVDAALFGNDIDAQFLADLEEGD